MVNILAKIESVLSAYCRPGYLSVTFETDDSPYILCILSHSKYNKIPIAERVQSVYNILETHCSDILKENTIIVQVFSNIEFEKIIEDLFPGR